MEEIKIIVRDAFMNRNAFEWYGPPPEEGKRPLLGRAKTLEGAEKHIKSIYGEDTEVEYKSGWEKDETLRSVVYTND